MSKKLVKPGNIYDEYLSYQKKYEKIYGCYSTVTLLMCGGFYELYGTDNDNLDLRKIAELLNIVYTRKNKNEPVSDNNPSMSGFPLSALSKYLKVLVANNYTIILVDQVGPNIKGKRQTRAVTNIFSPGTYLDEINCAPDSNDIVLLYIQDEIQLNGTILISVGMSCMDLSTGKSFVHESYSSIIDEKYGLDEATRFINSFNAKEIIIYRTESDNKTRKGFMNKEKIIAYLELENKKVFYYTKLDKHLDKIAYQNEMLSKIYKDHGMLTPLEYLDLDRTLYAAIAFVALLDFSYKHNENIINHILKPTVFHDNKKLVLGNNAVEQLNIISNGNTTENYNCKIKSLFDVVNNTSTQVGRRFLKLSLQIPLTDPAEINKRYNYIEELLELNYIVGVENHLKNIIDVERAHRKIAMNNIHPYEMHNLLSSYNEIINVINIISTTNVLKDILPQQNIIEKIHKFKTMGESIFDEKAIESANLNAINKSLFMKGHFVNIDALQHIINKNETILEDICAVLSRYTIDVTDKIKKPVKNVRGKKSVAIPTESFLETNIKPDVKTDMGNNCICYDYNEQDGYYLKISLAKSKIFKKNIADVENVVINGDLVIQKNNIKYKENKSGVKIKSKEIKQISNDIMDAKREMINLIYIEYRKLLTTLYNDYSDMFNEINKFVGFVDFIKSGAKTAKMNNYVKPELVISKHGFIDCGGLRHPLVEKINTDVEYVPHDIKIGKSDNNEISGIVLYGLNSAGKSTLSKSIAISIIMAQCGMYVSASKYKYSPYELLFARITGNDNILKGLSLYTIEMIETRAIINRSGPKTIVIGDEVCRGTEYISGNSIVAATLIHLSQSGSSFIFASHLHEIPTLKRIKELKNIKCYHLTVEVDDRENLIFDRQLKEGQGTTMYGIIVAKHIIKNDEFIKLAQELKCELLKNPNQILHTKTSKYNSKLYVDECGLCGVKISLDKFGGYLDTHHINEQQHCKDGFVIHKPHLKKNSKANLVLLCKECHQKEHNNELSILGYKQTSNGRILDILRK